MEFDALVAAYHPSEDEAMSLPGIKNKIWFIPNRDEAWLAEGCGTRDENCKFVRGVNASASLEQIKNGQPMTEPFGYLKSTIPIKIGDCIRWNYRELPNRKTAFHTLQPPTGACYEYSEAD